MKRLKIGIVAWSTGDNSFGVTKAYLHHISKYGDPVILCPMKDTIDVDMIVLPGGRDVSSYLYGQIPGYYTGEPDPHKEYFMQKNLDQYIEKGVPIWGTCLGFQQLVVKFGGKMVQHINVAGHGYSGQNRSDLVHPLVVTEEYKKLEAHLIKNTTLSYKKNEEKRLWSNSLHHQGVPVNGGVPDCMEIIAYTEDGYVEAVRHRELPIIGCQFHLEEDNNDLGRFLFEKLVKDTIDARSNKKVEGKFVEVSGDGEGVDSNL